VRLTQPPEKLPSSMDGSKGPFDYKEGKRDWGKTKKKMGGGGTIPLRPETQKQVRKAMGGVFK